MRNKKFKSIIAVILALLMVFSLLVSIIPIIAHADSELDDALQKLQEEKDTYAAQRKDLEAKLEKLRDNQAAAIDLKVALEEGNKVKQDELALIDEQIVLYNAMIEAKSQEVFHAKELEELQLERYRTRVRAMEETGGFNLLEVLLKAGSFNDLLTAFDDIGNIMAKDRALEDRYIQARLNHEEIKAEFEAVKEELEDKQYELVNEKTKLEAQISEAEQLLEDLGNEIEKTEEEQRKAADAEAAASANIIAFIQEYNRKKAEQLAQQQAQQKPPQPSQDAPAEGGSESDGGSSDGGDSGSGEQIYGDGYSGGVTGPDGPTDPGYAGGVTGGDTGGGGYSAPSYFSVAWPVPNSHRISSTFKFRWGRQHTGVDIDGYGLDGYPVCAASSGTVIYAGYNGGYGNCVIIDHGYFDGQSYQTLYAHMSSIYVSSGQYVSQGEGVGGLGSTGNSTGTHCHFEIIIDGTQYDPLGWLSGYELEPGAAD